MTIAAFERAVARAVDYLQASDAQAAPLIEKFTRSKPEVIAGTGLPSWSNTLSVDKINVQMQLMVKYGLLEKPLDANELIWHANQQ